MRKKIIGKGPEGGSPENGMGLDVEHIAQVEITSEDAAFPVEGAFKTGGDSSWRASEAGTQSLRLVFDEPQRIHQIQLLFQEDQLQRTQEFVLQWSPSHHQPSQEIVRQQFTFSPDSTTREQENYSVDLKDVKVVELTIKPDISGGNARASLHGLWIA